MASVWSLQTHVLLSNTTHRAQRNYRTSALIRIYKRQNIRYEDQYGANIKNTEDICLFTAERPYLIEVSIQPYLPALLYRHTDSL